MMQEIRKGRPFYGTRRVAADMSRMLCKSINRKVVRRIYKKMEWGKPWHKDPLEAHQGRLPQ